MRRICGIPSWIVTGLCLIWMIHLPCQASELSFFDNFGTQYRIITKAPVSAAEETAQDDVQNFRLERPDASDTSALPIDDALGLFTPSPVTNIANETLAERIDALKVKYQPATDPVFDTDWEHFAESPSLSNLWKATLKTMESTDTTEKTLTLLIAATPETRQIFKKLIYRSAADHQALRTGRQSDTVSLFQGGTIPGSYRASDTYQEPELPPEHTTERFRSSEEEDELFFGIQLNPTTIILLLVGGLIVAVVCKRLPY